MLLYLRVCIVAFACCWLVGSSSSSSLPSPDESIHTLATNLATELSKFTLIDFKQRGKAHQKLQSLLKHYPSPFPTVLKFSKDLIDFALWVQAEADRKYQATVVAQWFLLDYINMSQYPPSEHEQILHISKYMDFLVTVPEHAGMPRHMGEGMMGWCLGDPLVATFMDKSGFVKMLRDFLHQLYDQNSDVKKVIQDSFLAWKSVIDEYQPPMSMAADADMTLGGTKRVEEDMPSMPDLLVFPSRWGIGLFGWHDVEPRRH